MAPTVILRCVGNAEVLTLAAVAGVVALCIGYGVAIEGEIGRGACPRSSEGDRSATTFLLPSEAATPDRRWSTALWECVGRAVKGHSGRATRACEHNDTSESPPRRASSRGAHCCARVRDREHNERRS